MTGPLALAICAPHPHLPPQAVALYWRRDWPGLTLDELGELCRAVAAQAGPGYVVLAWGRDDTPLGVVEVVPDA